MSNANITLVQSLYAAFNRGDIATIIAALAPDIAWHVHGRPKDHPGFGAFKAPEGVQTFFGAVAETLTPTDFSPREYDAAGDKVFVRGHYAWTTRKTGRKVDTDFLHVFVIKGGKVTAFDEFTDTAQFAEAMRA